MSSIYSSLPGPNSLPPDPSQPNPLTTAVQGIVENYLSDPLNLPDAFRSWIPAFIEVQPPVLPISQVSGFSQFQATASYTAGSFNPTAGNTFATVAAPSLTSLPDGGYLVLFGFQAQISNSGVRSGISINGATPAAPFCLVQNNDAADLIQMSAAAAFVTTMSNGLNTLQTQYDSNLSVSVGAVQDRWIIALKYANP